MAIDIVILVALVLVMRIAPRMACVGVVPGSDAYAHMLFARYYRDHGEPLPWRWQGMEGVGYYPYLYHWLLALGGEGYRRAAEVVSSSLCDAVATVAVYGIAGQVLSRLGVGPGAERFPFWLALIFCTSPVFFQRKTGPRSFEGTPRALGETLFLLMVLLAIAPGLGLLPTWLGLALAVLVAGLMLLCSKFSLQALVLMAVAWAALEGRVAVLLFPLAAMAAATILSRGGYLRVLKLHYAHLRDYALVGQRINRDMIDRNNPRRIAAKIADYWRRREWRRIAGVLARDITPTALVYRCPQFVLALVVVIIGAGGCGRVWMFDGSGWSPSVWHTWFWAAVFPLVLTSFYPFLFVGEAERYQNCSLLPQYLFITCAAWQLGLCPWLLAAQLVLYFFYAAIFVADLRRAGAKGAQLQAAAAFVQERYGTAAVAAVLREATYELEYRLGHGEVFPNLREDDFSAYYKYPHARPDAFASMVRERGARAIVIERDAERDMGERYGKPYDFSPWPQEVFGNERYYVRHVGD